MTRFSGNTKMKNVHGTKTGFFRFAWRRVNKTDAILLGADRGNYFDLESEVKSFINKYREDFEALSKK